MPVSSSGSFTRRAGSAARPIRLTKTRLLGLVLLFLGLVVTTLVVVAAVLR